MTSSSNDIFFTLNSIADLKTLTTHVGIVNVDGYYNPGDGGGGKFYWDASSALSDSALSIVPNGWSGNGRWIRLIQSDFFDIKWFGAMCDGITDDADAWDAMMSYLVANGGGKISLPHGLLYSSRDLVIPNGAKVHISGRGGASGTASSGFKLAPLRRIFVQSPHTTIENFDLIQTTAIVSAASWSSLFNVMGAQTSNYCRQPSTFYSKGYCVVKGSATYSTHPLNPSGGGPTVMFRASTAGTSSSGSEPSGFASTTIGFSFTDGSVTWVCEALPQLWQANTTYTTGQRIVIPGDNRFYYECTGVTGDAKSGAVMSSSFAQPGLSATSEPRGTSITDNHVTWLPYYAGGIVVIAGMVRLNHFIIQGGMGYGVHIDSNTSAGIIADFVRVENAHIFYTGGGIALHGDDANGCTTKNISYYGISFYGTDYIYEVANANFQNGQICIWDRSQKNTHIGHYSQFAVAPAYVSDDAASSITLGTDWSFGTTGVGGGSVWVGCNNESAASYYAVGNIIASDSGPNSGAMLVTQNYVKNFKGNKTYNSGKTIHYGLDNGESTYPSWTSTDTYRTMGWWYEYAGDAHEHAEGGWDSYGYAPYSAQFLFGASHHDARNTGDGYGPGAALFRIYHGYFLGASIATAPYYGEQSFLTFSGLRYGKRIVGDRFQLSAAPSIGTWQEIVCTTQGYRGVKWSAGLVYNTEQDYPYGTEATIVEPSTSPTYLTDGTTRVWKYTGSFTNNGVEPIWPASGNFTDAHGNTWVDMGVTAVFKYAGFVDDQVTGIIPQTHTLWSDTSGSGGTLAPKVSVASIRNQPTNTTTNGALQTIFTIDNALFSTPSASGNLADNATYHVDLVIQAKSPAAHTEAGSCKISADFYCDGGNLIRIGTDSNSPNFLGGSVCALTISGKTLLVQVTPGINATVAWGIVGQVEKRID